MSLASSGGYLLHASTNSLTHGCDPSEVGACCRTGQTCTETTEAACDALGGFWLGPGTVCSPNPCPANCSNCGGNPTPPAMTVSWSFSGTNTWICATYFTSGAVVCTPSNPANICTSASDPCYWEGQDTYQDTARNGTPCTPCPDFPVQACVQITGGAIRATISAAILIQQPGTTDPFNECYPCARSGGASAGCPGFPDICVPRCATSAFGVSGMVLTPSNPSNLCAGGSGTTAVATGFGQTGTLTVTVTAGP